MNPITYKLLADAGATAMVAATTTPIGAGLVLAGAAGALGGCAVASGVWLFKDDIIQTIDKAVAKIKGLMKNATKEIYERTLKVLGNLRAVFVIILNIQISIKGSDEKSVKAREVIQRRQDNIMKEVTGMEEELAALGFTEAAEAIHDLRGDIANISSDKKSVKAREVIQRHEENMIMKRVTGTEEELAALGFNEADAATHDLRGKNANISSDEKYAKACEAIQRSEENIIKEVTGLEDELAELGFAEAAAAIHDLRGDIANISSDEKYAKACEEIQRSEENIIKEVTGLEDKLVELGFAEAAAAIHDLRGDIANSKTAVHL